MSTSTYIYKSHTISVLLYHFIYPAKYRKIVFSEAVDKRLKKACLEISIRYQINYLEIRMDNNHVHYLAQSFPSYSVT